MILNILSILIIALLILFNKMIFKNILCPINVFLVIWGIVLTNSLFVLAPQIDVEALLYSLLFVVAFAIPAMFIHPKKNKKLAKLNMDDILVDKKKTFEKLIQITLVFRVIQIIYFYFVIRSLGGSISMIFGDAQGLRFAYLDYSSGISSLFFKIFVNIINYVSELGVLISALYSFKFRKMKYVIIAILLSLFSSIFSMSKLAFGIDVIFVLATISLFTYKDDLSSKFEKKRLRKVFMRTAFSLAVVAFFLLTIVSVQRGYQNKVSGISSIDNIVIFQLIAYLVTPYMAFVKMLSWDINFSYGIRTFYPFLKGLDTSLQNFGSINVGIEETTVFTMPGVFYTDFGFLGSLVAVFIFSWIVNYSYKVMIEKRTFISYLVYSTLFVCLVLSFFTWMGRITFFWLFPLIATIIINLFIIRRIKI